jgi:voltage-gated potassium channel
MLSALLMLHRVVRAVRHAIRDENFLPVGSAGVLLVFVGTLSYSLGEDWNVLDAFYFSVSTLTTTSVADPELVLEHDWMKIFTVFYLLIGIGILVEVLRRLGASFVAVRAEDRARKSPET